MQIYNFEMSFRNVISNNCSPFSHRLHQRARQRAKIEIERLTCKETGPLASLFYCPLQESKSGMVMPKVPVVSRYLIAYLASFVAVAPFFRAKVAPFFRANDILQIGTVKFFDKALCKLAGMKYTVLSAFLHRKATAWYKLFPPIHSPDRAEDPKTPQVDGGDGAGGVARGGGGCCGVPHGVQVFIG